MKPPGMMVASSPGREKLPVPAPPGFARLFGASRSRGRSSSSARSSPMFVSRSRSVGRSSATSQTASAAAEGGEPSSPKVTCIGQVRMRNKRSAAAASMPKKVSPPSKKVGTAPLMPCRCLHKAFICSLFPARKKPKDGANDARRSLWRNWSSLSFKSGGSAAAGGVDGYQQQKLDPVRLRRPELMLRGKETDDEKYKEEAEEEEMEEVSEHEEETRVFVSSSATATPPKNALLLMRCRSAPHNRASALATARFAVSPLPLSFEPPAAEPKEEEGTGMPELKTGEEKMAEEEKQEEEEGKKGKSRNRETMPAAAEDDDEEEEEEEGTGSESQRPLVLARSKSEPARSAAAKLVAAPSECAAPATYCFWNNSSGSSRWQRRWGLFHDERTPQPLVPLSVRR